MEAHGLDEVIEQLKSKGIEAGKDEASRIVDEAKEKADQIVKQAEEKAEDIVKDANEEAEKTKRQMEAELQNTTQVALAAFRQSMEKGFVLPEVDKAIKPVVTKPDFMEKAISELIKAFASSGFKEGGIRVLLPEKLQKELEGAFVQKLRTRAGAKVEVAFDDSITYGFQIGPSDGRFVLDLSQEGFRQIFMKFLSPRFREYFREARKDESGGGGKAAKPSEKKSSDKAKSSDKK
jgi:V/A-type H+-transporting ATPase subunit E